ncbi:VOC family protein [Streptosporangium sp. NPDC000396]|uniref:VOC family protein n=1 Tax=Streptosporangium sp. NPDC000396 TaxID=3366185 RepID=UPI0036CD35BC
MSERSGYKSGVPCWVDLSSTDVTLSVRFYREVFGWEAVFDPRPESGGYGRFTLNGRAVAGIGPSAGDGVPAVWNTYMATEDADITAARVREAGGKVLMAPVRVFDEGCMAVFQDPSGASFMAWQAGRHQGAEIAGEPGAFARSELVTRDTAACGSFYPAVLGWDAGDDTRDTPHTEWRVDGRPVAWMTEMGPWFPPGTPSHWMTYFAVEDVDATAARVQELGGTVLAAPAPTRGGRAAVVADPQLAAFAVIRLDGPPE